MKKIGFLLLSACLLLGCSASLQKHSIEMFDVGFDTVLQMIGYTKDEESFNTYSEQAKTMFQHYNELFDRYTTYEGVNNIKTINDNAGIAPVIVDQEIIDVLNLTKQYSEASAQQYDVTMGSVFEVWHNYRDAGKLANENGNDGVVPSMQELQDAKQCAGWDNVEIDEAKRSVYIKNSCTSLDLGSAAKGYAVEQVAKKLEEEGFTSGILNAGGNVRLIGEKPDGEWNVGIQIPNAELTNTTSIANVVLKENTSFVTSGDYQRYYTADGVMYHHIIDPHTLLPARHMRSVTIVTPDSGMADILSTTLFTMSYQDGSAFLDTLRKQGMDVEAIWVFDETTQQPELDDMLTKDGYTLAISDGLKEHVTLEQ